MKSMSEKKETFSSFFNRLADTRLKTKREDIKLEIEELNSELDSADELEKSLIRDCIELSEKRMQLIEARITVREALYPDD